MNDENDSLALEVENYVLGCVIRALDPKSKKLLLSKTGDSFQEELSEVEAVSDPSVSLTSLIDGVISRFGLSEVASQTALVHAVNSIIAKLSDRDLSKIRHHLPEDLQTLFFRPHLPQVA